MVVGSVGVDEGKGLVVWSVSEVRLSCRSGVKG